MKYTSAGDQLPTVLSTAVQGGNPPSIAALPQPGLMKDFVSRGVLKPIDFAKGVVSQNYSPDWVKLGTVNGHLYGFVFKGANKSTVWYNVPAFKSAGITPPTTWTQLLADAKTLKASGVPAYSIGGADGWTLTDLFENIYLRTAGPAMYDQLTAHTIPWTDPSVTTALKDMALILGDTSNIAGGATGALQTDFPTSVTQRVLDPAQGRHGLRGRLRRERHHELDEGQGGHRLQPVPVPVDQRTGRKLRCGRRRHRGPVQGHAGLRGSRSTTWHRRRRPRSGPVWAASRRRTRASTANVYPDPVAKQTAVALAQAATFRFDMSDQAPASFGGTVGQGEWKLLQDFLRNPSNISGI